MAYPTPTFLRKALLGSALVIAAGFAAPLANAAPAAKTKVTSMSAQETILVAEKMQRPDRAARRTNRNANQRGNRRDSDTNNRSNHRDRSQNHAEHRRDGRTDNHRSHNSRGHNTGNHTVRNQGHASRRSYTPRRSSTYRPGYRRHASQGYYTPYRSNLGISFHFGTPGYSRLRWAPTAYSFYRPAYGHYNGYRSRTTCRRVTIDGWHHGHRELVSVKQCSNPWDGAYIVQGSERVIACRW